jgi:hypothetical protein
MELDLLYVPSADVAADAAYWVNVLGARLVFAAEERTVHFVRDAGGQRVAVYQLTRPEVAKDFVCRTDFPIGPASEKPAKRSR